MSIALVAEMLLGFFCVYFICWGVNVPMVHQSNAGLNSSSTIAWAERTVSTSQSHPRARTYWSEMFLEHRMSRPMASERAEVTDFNSLHISRTLTWQYSPLLYVNFTELTAALFANDPSKDTRVIVEWFAYLPWIPFTCKVQRTVSAPRVFLFIMFIWVPERR